MVWLPPIPKTEKELRDKQFQQNINLAAECDRYHKALTTISKARLEPGHVYEQALMLQKIADKALEGK